ncbi:MAG: hypothetical protein AAGJ89_17890 [Pseudomonadota bacterium]
MAPPGGKDLSYKIFGLDHMEGEVFADAFARQVNTILTSLGKIDKELNGGKRFEYMVSGLAVDTSDRGATAQSAQIEFREKVISEKPIQASPCSRMVSVGVSVGGAQTFESVSNADEVILDALAKLSKKAGQRFNYATMRNGGPELIRVDPFLSGQVAAIVNKAQKQADQAVSNFFVGSAIGSFDGVIEAVDLAGDAPSARLILSAGGKPIDSVLFDMDLEEVRMALGSRVRVTGRAIYGAASALPVRIEIRSIERVGQSSIIDLAGSMPSIPFDFWTDAD